MASAPRPTVSLSKVPSIKKLCEDLGIQHASLKDSTVFMDAIHAFRKSCTTSNGSLVAKLVDWNLPSVQRDLRAAAVKFLDDNGNGERFWNPTRPWAQPSDLHYPQHRDSIIDLLVQLFWKQNRYLDNNSRYNGKTADSHSRGGSADQSTPAREVHQQSATSPTASFQAQKRKNESKMSTASTRPTQVVAASLKNAEGSDLRGIAATHKPPEFDDMFDVPRSSDDQDAPKRPFTSAQSSKHSRIERPDYENSARKRKKHQIEDSPRRTERKRHPRCLPETVPLEVVNRLLDMADADADAESDPPSPLSGVSRKQQSDPSVFLQPHRTFSAAGGPAQILSDQSDLPNGPFAAPTAAMISTQQHTAPQPSLSTDQPIPSRKVVRLKMSHLNRIQKNKKLPPNRTAGIRSSIYNANIEKALLSESASVRPELDIAVSSTGREPRSPSTSPQSPQSIASADDSDLVPHGFAREDFGFSLQTKSLATNCANSVSPPNKLPPSLQPATAPSPEIKLPTTKRPHATPETSTVSQTLSELSTPVPRPRIQISFWIITREPLYTEELWNEGKFQGLLLCDFLDGITKVTQRGAHIEKIKLTLRTPFSNTILTVYADAEDAWTTAKAAFAEKLKESRAEARKRGVDDSTGYKILIEPFYEQGFITGGGAEADDDVFDY